MHLRVGSSGPLTVVVGSPAGPRLRRPWIMLRNRRCGTRVRHRCRRPAAAIINEGRRPSRRPQRLAEPLRRQGAIWQSRPLRRRKLRRLRRDGPPRPAWRSTSRCARWRAPALCVWCLERPRTPAPVQGAKAQPPADQSQDQELVSFQVAADASAPTHGELEAFVRVHPSRLCWLQPQELASFAPTPLMAELSRGGRRTWGGRTGG